jgi:hypothetical protein
MAVSDVSRAPSPRSARRHEIVPVENHIHDQNRPAQADVNHKVLPRCSLQHRQTRVIRKGIWRAQKQSGPVGRRDRLSLDRYCTEDRLIQAARRS